MSLKPKAPKMKRKKKSGKPERKFHIDMKDTAFLIKNIGDKKTIALNKTLINMGVENVKWVEQQEDDVLGLLTIGVDRYVSEGQVWYYTGGHVAADDATKMLEREIWNGAVALRRHVIFKSLKGFSIQEQNRILEMMEEGRLRDDVVKSMARGIVNQYGFERVLEGDSEIWKPNKDKFKLKRLNGNGYILTLE